jgi:hypothetical protein
MYFDYHVGGAFITALLQAAQQAAVCQVQWPAREGESVDPGSSFQDAAKARP